MYPATTTSSIETTEATVDDKNAVEPTITTHARTSSIVTSRFTDDTFTHATSTPASTELSDSEDYTIEFSNTARGIQTYLLTDEDQFPITVVYMLSQLSRNQRQHGLFTSAASAAVTLSTSNKVASQKKYCYTTPFNNVKKTYGEAKTECRKLIEGDLWTPTDPYQKPPT